MIQIEMFKKNFFKNIKTYQSLLNIKKGDKRLLITNFQLKNTFGLKLIP
jgi:hypothetical protein